MRLGVVLESEFETRVSIVPNSIPKLVKMGFEVVVEDGAGKKSGYPNSEYEGIIWSSKLSPTAKNKPSSSYIAIFPVSVP